MLITASRTKRSKLADITVEAITSIWRVQNVCLGGVKDPGPGELPSSARMRLIPRSRGAEDEQAPKIDETAKICTACSDTNRERRFTVGEFDVSSQNTCCPCQRRDRGFVDVAIAATEPHCCAGPASFHA